MTNVVLAVPETPSTPAQTLNLYVPLPDLPGDLINAGDRLDLSASVTSQAIPVTPQLQQVVTISRLGRLVLFAASMPGTWSTRAVLPSFADHGLTLTDEGISCTWDALGGGVFVGCLSAQHEAGVAFGGHTGRALVGETVRVGDLTIRFTSFMSRVGTHTCDGPTPTLVAGFVQPAQ